MKGYFSVIFAALFFADVGHCQAAVPLGTKVSVTGDKLADPDALPLSGTCRRQNVAERTFSAGDYPIQGVNSPYAESYELTVVPGSFSYFIDKPTAIGRPYTIGSTGDFDGFADICRFFDRQTGQFYERVAVNSAWRANSGGVYNVQFNYIPFTPGVGALNEQTTVQSVFVVDGATLKSGDPQDPNRCLDGAVQEETRPTRDLTLAPLYYVKNHDVAMMYLRGWFKPWTGVDSVTDVIKEIDKAALAKGAPVEVVFASHGNIDLWAMGGNGKDLVGQNDNVKKLGKEAKGKISKLFFASCCTGKKKANGAAVNILDTLAEALSDGGKQRVSVCGLEHMSMVWFRDGEVHFGTTKGDSKPCANR